MKSFYHCILAILISFASETFASGFSNGGDSAGDKDISSGLDSLGNNQPPNFQILCDATQKSPSSRKPINEDRIISTQLQVQGISSPVKIFGVFDGHGGAETSEWLKNNFSEFLTETLNSVAKLDVLSVKEAINSAVYKADAEICNVAPKDETDYFMRTWTDNGSGATASFFVTFDDEVFVVNIGDSRSIIYNTDTQNIVFETKDHKPDDPDERSHIEKVGGKVSINGVPRVSGLAMSRVFGDCMKKKTATSIKYNPDGIVRVTPDIEHYKVEKGANFVLLSATDGLFDPENSTEYVHNSLKSASADSCSSLIKIATDSGSTDDISVIMISSKEHKD